MSGGLKFAEAIPDSFSPLMVCAGRDTRSQNGVRIENWRTLTSALDGIVRQAE